MVAHSAGGVHPGIAAQAQNVLDLGHGQRADTAPGACHGAPADAGLLIQMQIAPGEVPLALVCNGVVPLDKGGSVVSTGIHDRVGNAVVGQEGALVRQGVEGVYQHTHAGDAGALDKGSGFLVQLAQILRNKLGGGNVLMNGV